MNFTEAIEYSLSKLISSSWPEMEDNMAPKHARFKRFVDFKYGSFIKALYARSKKSICNYFVNM